MIFVIFFMPNKDPKEFSIKESLDEVLRIIGKSITNQNIEIVLTISKDKRFLGIKMNTNKSF